MQNLAKFIQNAAIGNFAVNRSRFTQTKILDSGGLYNALRNPRLKSLDPLTNDGNRMDPLHEASFKRKQIIEDLAIHVQISVYQNSKLLMYKFLDVLKKFMEPGTVKFCYCDTDSLMLALTRDSLLECVKPELIQEWNSLILPKWFVDEDSIASQKEPGLLKEEARLTKGMFIALSPKCYIMTECDPSYLEERLCNPENRHKIYEILDEANSIKYDGVEKKRSSKGCNKKIGLM